MVMCVLNKNSNVLFFPTQHSSQISTPLELSKMPTVGKRFGSDEEVSDGVKE
jgi:hypothetical protein